MYRVDQFEYTQECIVFDLLNIRLYHGWLVDPENCQELSAVSNYTYNQLVEQIINKKSAQNEAAVLEGQQMKTINFLANYSLISFYILNLQ